MMTYNKQCAQLMNLEKAANDFAVPTTRSMQNKMISLENRNAGLPQVKGEENCAALRAKEALIEITGFLAED